MYPYSITFLNLVLVVQTPTGQSVPREFFSKHVQKNKQIATLRYSNRSWQVKLKSYEHRDMAFLTTGWSSYARETGLYVGDVCGFELIDRGDIAFRVSIFSSDGKDLIYVDRDEHCKCHLMPSRFPRNSVFLIMTPLFSSSVMNP